MAEIFVIMPFGVKSIDQGAGMAQVNFDDVYHKFIHPACTAIGWSPRRIDEVSFSGTIGSEIVKYLASSDVVIADLTAENPNVYFELGIRQSLTERPTILIASRGTQLPFDIHDQRVVFYGYPAAPFSETEVAQLSNAIEHANSEGARSPILTRLREFGILANPQDKSDFEADLRQKIARARSLEQLMAIWYWAAEQSPLPAYLLIDLADRVAAHHDWQLAEKIAARAVIEKPNDFELHRRYGWYLRNQGSSRYQEAEAQFRLALKFNSADPETLGMLGGLLKRTSRYKEAIECYEKGLRLSPSTLYMRIAHTGMMLLNEIIEKREPINGQALYKQLYEDVLKDKNSQNDAWSLAVLGECSFVLGRKSESIEFFQKASRLAENPTVIESPADQIKLFGDYGFRTSDALQIVGILRVQALPVEVRSKDEHPQDTEREGEFGPLPIIVHLSDIHFGGRTDKDGSVQRMHRFFDGDYSQSLAKHLLAELVRPTGRFRLVGKPVSIVASGDLAYTATKEEFEEALVLFRILRDELKLKPEQFIFCPGNHDVDWAQSAIDKSTRFDRYLAFLRNFYGEPLFRELYPLITWDFSVDGTRPRPSDLVSTYFNREQGVLFASFNSCVYETEQHHYGFISLSQQQNIADLLDKLNVSSDVVRVAVVHHHVHPYPDFINLVGKDGHWVDMSTIRDGGLFERFLEKHNFDLVLHGHKHKPQLRETVVRDRHSHDQIKPLIVCGAGSCGVAESELEHSTGNQFQVLEVVNRKRMARAEFVRIEWRELSLDAGAEWATTRVWNVLGG